MNHLLESVHTVLKQPGTLVSFQGMFIYLLFDFRKLWIFQCFPFLENSRTPTFPISGTSGLRHFLLLVIRSCISLFTCDSVVFPCFMLLFSFIYSGLLSVPGTSLFHSLAYKYLYSVARTAELRLLLFLFHSSDSSSLWSPLLVTHFRIWKFRSPEFPRSLALGNPGSLRDSTGNRAIPWVRPGN